MMVYSLILACTLDGGIGLNNNIPWNIREETELFKKITTDKNCYIKKNAVIMGRNTWDSLPFKPLKNRINIIITSNVKKIDTSNDNIYVFHNLENAFRFCEENVCINKVFVIGGKSLYDLCLYNEKYSKYIDNIHLSIIKDKYTCDTFIDLKYLLKTYKKYNIYNDIVFNSSFIYMKLLL
jgi:dihydrofolate reductase